MEERSDLIHLFKDEAIIEPSERLYILVHPFHPSKDERYLKNIKSLISDSTDPILTLDDYRILNYPGGNSLTNERFKALNPAGERYFLGNYWNIAEPYLTWEGTFDIVDQFLPEEIIVSGSTLQINNNGYEECVGWTFNEFKNRYNGKVNLDKDLCHIQNNPMMHNGTITTVEGLMEFFNRYAKK